MFFHVQIALRILLPLQVKDIEATLYPKHKLFSYLKRTQKLQIKVACNDLFSKLPSTDNFIVIREQEGETYHNSSNSKTRKVNRQSNVLKGENYIPCLQKVKYKKNSL